MKQHAVFYKVLAEKLAWNITLSWWGGSDADFHLQSIMCVRRSRLSFHHPIYNANIASCICGGQDSFTVWSVTILGSNLIFWFTQHTFWVLFRRSRTAPGLLTSVVLIGTSVSLEILVVPSLRWGHYSSIRFLKTVSLVLISVSIFYSIHEHTGRAGRAYSLSQETEIIVREYIRSFYS